MQQPCLFAGVRQAAQVFLFYASFNARRFQLRLEAVQAASCPDQASQLFVKATNLLQKFTGMPGRCGLKRGCGDLREKSEAKFHFLRSFQRPGTLKFAMRPYRPKAAGIRPRNPTTLRKECRFLQKFTGMRKSAAARRQEADFSLFYRCQLLMPHPAMILAAFRAVFIDG